MNIKRKLEEANQQAYTKYLEANKKFLEYEANSDKEDSDTEFVLPVEYTIRTYVHVFAKDTEEAMDKILEMSLPAGQYKDETFAVLNTDYNF